MNQTIPSAAEVSARLAHMNGPQLQRLAGLSGVPFHTLLKIKSQETSNPRLETVRQFLPHIDAAQAEPATTGG